MLHVNINTIQIFLRLTILFAFGTNMDFVIGTYKGFVIFLQRLTKTSVRASPKPSDIMADTA